jgi:signal transduction histidine kinase
VSDVTARKTSEEGIRLLADVSSQLAQVLDDRGALESAVGVAVPAFADAGVFCLLAPGGDVQEIVTAHRDPSKAGLLRSLLEKTGLPLPEIQRLVAGGGSRIWNDVSEEKLLSIAGTPEQRAQMQALAPRSILAVPLKQSEGVTGLALFLQDDPRRTFAQADRLLAEELVRRVGIALENARLYRELKRADERKDEFLAMLAHELRNPLSPIRHAVTLLKSEDLPEDVSGQALDIMDRQVDQLVRLVNDLLDVSRILRGKIDLHTEPIQLRTIVDRAVETVRPLIDEQRQALSVTVPAEPVWLNADGLRLGQAVSNLLNNAAKYTPPGGRIQVEASASENGVDIAVRDDGAGIAPHVLPHIFDLFAQADQTIERAQGGLGIGLTVVRSLVEMHGGTVAGDSAGVGQGSTFTIRLPRAPIDSSEVSTPWAPAEVRPLRILVVEDNVGAATLLSRLLQRFWNHQVRVAHDGLHALEEARRFLPELILTDIGLPRMSGYEIARTLRQEPAFARTLIVALTGYGQSSDRQLSQEAGFDEHLVKPADVRRLERLFSLPRLSEQR